MRKILAAFVAAAVVAGGAVLAASISGGGVATAQNEPDESPPLDRHPHHGRCGPLMQLVEDGVIEEEQAEAVRQAMREAIADRIESGAGRPDDPAVFLEDVVEGLVPGTLDQEQADAAVEALRDAGERFRGHRRHHFRPGAILDEALGRLVDDGTLNQNEVDAINETIREVIAERIRSPEDLGGADETSLAA